MQIREFSANLGTKTLPAKKLLTFSSISIAEVKEHNKIRLELSNPGSKKFCFRIYRGKYSEKLTFSPQKWSFFEVGKCNCDKATASLPV